MDINNDERTMEQSGTINAEECFHKGSKHYPGSGVAEEYEQAFEKTYP